MHRSRAAGQCIGIDAYTIHPHHAKHGATFTATAEITVYNQTGTGARAADAAACRPPRCRRDDDPADGPLRQPVRERLAQRRLPGCSAPRADACHAAQPGNYTTTVTVDTSGREASDDAAPPFSAGNYSLQIFFCEGECGSAHEWSKIYAQGSVNFTLTS